jgi:hypothetical protein
MPEVLKRDGVEMAVLAIRWRPAIAPGRSVTKPTLSLSSMNEDKRNFRRQALEPLKRTFVPRIGFGEQVLGEIAPRQGCDLVHIPDVFRAVVNQPVALNGADVNVRSYLGDNCIATRNPTERDQIGVKGQIAPPCW